MPQKIAPPSRRRFMATAGTAALGLSVLGWPKRARAAGSVFLPPLPYDQKALQPHISDRTLRLHYGKHHAGYVKKLNRLIAGSRYASMPLEEIVLESYGREGEDHIFNNAAQVWNHTFYWQSMKPGGGGEPPAKLANVLQKGFGSLDKFKQAFARAAGGQFGSGWAWLALDGDIPKALGTGNAETPLTMGYLPLITIDLWEHAYYLDYQNRRGDYIKAWLEHLVNWEFAARNLEQSEPVEEGPAMAQAGGHKG